MVIYTRGGPVLLLSRDDLDLPDTVLGVAQLTDTGQATIWSRSGPATRLVESRIHELLHIASWRANAGLTHTQIRAISRELAESFIGTAGRTTIQYLVYGLPD